MPQEPQSWMYTTIKQLILSDTEKCKQQGKPKEKYIAHVDNKKRLIWTMLWKMEKVDYSPGQDVMESTLSFKNFLEMPDIDRVIRKVIQINPDLDPDPEARTNKERAKRVEYSPINAPVIIDNSKDESIYQKLSKTTQIEAGEATRGFSNGLDIAKQAMEKRRQQLRDGIEPRKPDNSVIISDQSPVINVADEAKKIGWDQVPDNIPATYIDFQRTQPVDK